MQAKVALLKVHVGTTSALLSVADHRVSVGLLRAIRVIIVHLIGLRLTAMTDIVLLSMH